VYAAANPVWFADRNGFNVTLDGLANGRDEAFTEQQQAQLGQLQAAADEAMSASNVDEYAFPIYADESGDIQFGVDQGRLVEGNHSTVDTTSWAKEGAYQGRTLVGAGHLHNTAVSHGTDPSGNDYRVTATHVARGSAPHVTMTGRKNGGGDFRIIVGVEPANTSQFETLSLTASSPLSRSVSDDVAGRLRSYGVKAFAASAEGGTRNLVAAPRGSILMTP
jgi:hypothetical protein